MGDDQSAFQANNSFIEIYLQREISTIVEMKAWIGCSHRLPAVIFLEMYLESSKCCLEIVGNEHDATPSHGLMDLLGTRETYMRLSPLLMVVSIGKNYTICGKFQIGG